MRLSGPLKGTDLVAYDFPLRGGSVMSQLVIPRVPTTSDIKRIAHFLNALRGDMDTRICISWRERRRKRS